jgi:hypothetical protein
MMMELCGVVSVIIGRGPAHDLGSSIAMVVFGIFFAVAGFASGTRVGAAFSHGKGPTVPINPAGRVILFALALVLLVAGLRGFFH